MFVLWIIKALTDSTSSAEAQKWMLNLSIRASVSFDPPELLDSCLLSNTSSSFVNISENSVAYSERQKQLNLSSHLYSLLVLLKLAPLTGCSCDDCMLNVACHN